MNFPSESGGEENEQVKLIVAGVFLRRLIIEFHSTNLMVIALGADVFFWVVGEIDCSCSLGAAVFRLFGDTDINIAAGGAISDSRQVDRRSSRRRRRYLCCSALAAMLPSGLLVHIPPP
jgi:hypothetical protein